MKTKIWGALTVKSFKKWYPQECKRTYENPGEKILNINNT